MLLGGELLSGKLPSSNLAGGQRGVVCLSSAGSLHVCHSRTLERVTLLVGEQSLSTRMSGVLEAGCVVGCSPADVSVMQPERKCGE